MVICESGRADPGQIHKASLSASTLHLIAGPQGGKDGRTVHASLVHGFPSDPKVLALNDEYIFGPAFFVAGSLTGYDLAYRLFAGGDGLYDLDQRDPGGQSIAAAAPIDQLPLFVRAGSIFPFGNRKHHTAAEDYRLRVYLGVYGDATFSSDDGHTYDYETGQSKLTTSHYNDKKRNVGLRRQPALPADLHPRIVQEK